jgi:hypothetical protein
MMCDGAGGVMCAARSETKWVTLDTLLQHLGNFIPLVAVKIKLLGLRMTRKTQGWQY